MHYKSSSNCYKDIFSNREYFYTRLRDLRLDFADLFTYEAMDREKKGHKSVVFTLTYNDEHIHNFYGLNVLDSDDLHKRLSKASAFGKRLLRHYGLEFDYICVGEYGNGGQSHNYVGKRGKGQNPHYHCVGWFAPKDGATPKFKMPSYERLCLLLREAWQGCEEDDPKIYGNSKELRALGLGYVRLQGEIISATKGCNYIAKYMGKDMLSLHNLAFDGIMPTKFKAIALDFIKQEFEELDSVHPNVYEDIFNKWINWLPSNHRLARCLHPPSSPKLSNEILRLVPYIGEELQNLFQTFLEDFTADFNRISPKLRHFKGFGMSILEYAKPQSGLYQRPLSNKLRALPATAKRKLYYDYSVSLIPNPHFDAKTTWFASQIREDRIPRYVKSVCYTLNSLGQQVLLKQTVARYEVRKMQLSAIGKKGYDYTFANLLLPFRHCKLTKEVMDSLFTLVDSGCDDASEYAKVYLQTINIVAPDWFREPNDSILYDVDKILRNDYPSILRAVFDIEKWYESLREKKDIDDSIFQEAWSSVYLSTY